MKGIEFDKENYKPFEVRAEEPKKSWAVNLMFKISGGKIKTEMQANLAWAVVVLLLICFSVYNFSSSLASTKTNMPTPQQLDEMQKIMSTHNATPSGN